MTPPNSPDPHHSHRRIAKLFYYAVGIILFFLGLTLMLLPHALHREGELWKILGELGTFLALIVALHFIYELLVKNEEHQLFITEIGRVVNSRIDALNETLRSERAVVYPTEASAYLAVIDVMARRSSQSGEKAILLAALHGHSGKRRSERPESDTDHKLFASQMQKCIMSSGPDKWYVREIYNVTDESRLKMVIDRINGAGDAEGYEVRAFCLQNVIPQLTPLVLGNEDLFIGWDDPTYYGIKGAIHVCGTSFVQSATDFFESLWNDKRAYVLRSGYGSDLDAIERLRRDVLALAKSRSPSGTRSRQRTPGVNL